MGAYVCPSCGAPLVYKENDLRWDGNLNNKGVTGECMNRNHCGVQLVTIIIDRDVEDAD